MKPLFLYMPSVLLLPGLYLLSLGGCGTLAGNPEGKTKPQASAVTFSLTDAPVENAKHVFITVKSLEVSLSGEGWVDIPLATSTEIDLLQFQDGKVTPLAALETLEPGTYNQTRLILAPDAPPRLIEDDGTEHPLTIPSASQSGIKITTPFTVEAEKPLKLTIDFDLRKSIKLTGSSNGNGQGAAQRKYMMKPVLRLLEDENTGNVTGNGIDGTTVCIYAEGTEKDTDNSCDLSENSAVVKDGSFYLAFIPAGTYDLKITPIDGAAYEKQGIVVKAGETAKTDVTP